MDVIADYIMNGTNEFSPEVLVRLFVFVLVLDCIGFIARSIMSVGK